MEDVTHVGAREGFVRYDDKKCINVHDIKAQMTDAELWMGKGDDNLVVKQYQTALKAKPGKPMAEMIRLRLARLFVDNGQYESAQEQLSLVQSQAYETMVEEIKGDIFVAENKLKKAQDAYQLALLSGEGYSGKALLEMKLSDVKVDE